jgi:hypothetical protein
MAQPKPEIIADAVAKLPDSLMTQLREATITLDVDRLNVLIGQVDTHNKALSKAIRRWVDRYDFESLGKMIKV